jgi:outer membrane lipoprotein SlyB
MKKTIALLLSVSMVAAGCAHTGADYRPIVDMQGRDYAKYEQDLRECQAYSAQAAGAGEQAAVGAVGGALFGTILAAVAGRGYSRNTAAGLGAVTGAAGGAASGERDQRNIIRTCLSNRGYSVLH